MQIGGSNPFKEIKNMTGANLERLSKKDLIKVIKMLSQNWFTVDGLWFRNVEEKYGMDAAMELDVKNWWRIPQIEARRIKETLNIQEKGIEGIIKTMNFMSWALSYPFEFEEITPTRAVMFCRHCNPQEARTRQGLGEFPCKPTGEAMFTRVIEVIDPRVQYRCIACPPEEHPPEFWCKWELTIPSEAAAP